MKFVFYSLFLVLSLYTNCTVDEGNTPAQLLQSGIWKLKSIKFKGIETTNPCNLDDTYSFGSANLLISDGKTLCIPSSAATVPYTFSSNGKNLSISGQLFEVTTLTINSLVISDTSKTNTLIQVFAR